MVENEEELKSLLMRVKEENEKASLKLNIQKLRSCRLVPSLHGKWRKSRSSDNFISWAPKSLQTVAVAMKLKDICSLEEKL